MKIGRTIFVLLFVGIVMTISCDKEDEVNKTDKELYEMAIATEGFVWYNNSEALLGRSSGSGHTAPFLRTRYNSVAATQLNEDGKILDNAIFPEESLVVKELYSDESALYQYAILLKNTSSEYADKDGWVWGYVDSSGKVLESATKKGVSCISCHTQNGSIDHMLMNRFFP